MLYIFSIYDSAAKYYMSPFVVHNKGIAIREFSDACNNPETFLAKHPADFTLFLLGSFDDLTAEYIPEPTPVRMGLALEFVKGKVIEPAPGFSRDDVN